MAAATPRTRATGLRRPVAMLPWVGAEAVGAAGVVLTVRVEVASDELDLVVVLFEKPLVEKDVRLTVAFEDGIALEIDGKLDTENDWVADGSPGLLGALPVPPV